MQIAVHNNDKHRAKLPSEIIEWSVDDVQQWLIDHDLKHHCRAMKLANIDGRKFIELNEIRLLHIDIDDDVLLAHIQQQLMSYCNHIPEQICNDDIDVLIHQVYNLLAFFRAKLRSVNPRCSLAINHNMPMCSPGKKSFIVTPKSRTHSFQSDTIFSLTKMLPIPHEKKAARQAGGALTSTMMPGNAGSSLKPELSNNMMAGSATRNTNDTMKRDTYQISNEKWFGLFNESDNHATAEVIANQVRFDEKLKAIRRGDRFVVPMELLDAETIEETDDNEAIERPPFIILPSHPLRIQWDIFMMLLVLYFAVVTPLTMAFTTPLDDLIALDLFLNTLFIFDIIGNFFTAFRIDKGHYKGQLEMRHSAIARSYLRRWFWIDVVASVPLDILMSSSGDETGGTSFNKLVKLLRGFKLIRVLRMSRIMGRLTSVVNLNPALFRLAKLFGILVFMWHWLACFYWMLASIEGFGLSTWTPELQYESARFITQYSQAFFWAVMATLGVGYDILPESDAETVFSIIAITIGVLMYAFIIASASSTADQLDIGTKANRLELEQMAIFLRQREVPKAMRIKVMSFIRYTQSRFLDDKSLTMFDELHTALHEELAICLNNRLVTNVSMFRDVSRSCMLSIIGFLQSRIYLPGEYVCLKGQRGLEMYFVAIGSIERFADPASNTAYKILKDGAVFCEEYVMTNQRLQTSYRAKEFTELRVLDRQSFKKLLKQYPSFSYTMQMYTNLNNQPKYWSKVRQALRLTKIIRKFNGKSDFETTMRVLNGLERLPHDVAQFDELKRLVLR